MTHAAFFDRQRAVRFDKSCVRDIVRRALPRIREVARPGSPLLRLERVEVSFLSPRRISEVHDGFLSDPTPTDVITFDHGEILVCPAVARENSTQFHRTLEEEIALCVIHGFLHLGGWEDATPAAAAAMAEIQEKILTQSRGG